MWVGKRSHLSSDSVHSGLWAVRQVLPLSCFPGLILLTAPYANGTDTFRELYSQSKSLWVKD